MYFHFSIKNSRKDLNFDIESTRQGWVVLNKFTPDYLKLYRELPGGQRNIIINTLEVDEFIRDCQLIVSCFDDNDLDYRDWNQCARVYIAVIDSHIKRFGRIVLIDLLTYSEEMCELMLAMGYSEIALRDYFPYLISAVVDIFGASVKGDESDDPYWGLHETPYLIEFTKTNRYQKLKALLPKFPNMVVID